MVEVAHRCEGVTGPEDRPARKDGGGSSLQGPNTPTVAGGKNPKTEKTYLYGGCDSSYVSAAAPGNPHGEGGVNCAVTQMWVFVVLKAPFSTAAGDEEDDGGASEARTEARRRMATARIWSNVRLKVAMIQENSNGLIIAEKALKEKETLYEKHLSNVNDTLEGLSKTKEDLVKKLAEIQAQIQDMDAKMTKLKKPFEKIQEKKAELGNQLLEIEKSKLQNEADLKKLQEEELQEIGLFKGFEDNKIQLKDTLEEFL
ncbi:hypothetical protein PIB30_067360 [Stylosanthes scabra]|uniref:Uncharacterized protein n=1 Tax=Stylosanthes scabra TaxID=79078 RepID=A0ABU6SN51_9FABA|nr:hypothetical protein [Stylosanthes scabra]